MTILSVQSEDEILLDGTRYRLRSRLTRQLVSVYPGKVVIGDTSRDSRPRTSILAYSDLRGGIGIERMKGARDADRVWWSTMDLSHDGHLVLPLRPVTLPRLPGSGDVTALGYLKGFIYVVFNRSVYKWDPATGWGNAVRTVDGIVHEVSTISIEDTTYLIVAHQEGTDYTTDGATWLSVGGVGTRDTSGDFTLGGNNSDPYAMIILTISGTDYILVGDRTDNKFYAYTKLGVRSATNDINSLPTSDLEGAAASDDYIFLLDSDAEKVFVINHAGVRQTGLDFDLDYVSSPTPRGIAVKSGGTTVLIADRDDGKRLPTRLARPAGAVILPVTSRPRCLSPWFTLPAWETCTGASVGRIGGKPTASTAAGDGYRTTTWSFRLAGSPSSLLRTGAPSGFLTRTRTRLLRSSHWI